MKMPLLLSVMLLIFFNTYSKGFNIRVDSCITPTRCSQDLRDTIFADADILVDTMSYAASGFRINFHDVKYKSGDCKGSKAPPDSTLCTDDMSVLKYYAFYPKRSVFDTTKCRLPAIAFFHGGGFQDCGGSLDDSGVVKTCRFFAQLGFICFDVEYRLGAQVPPGLNTYSAQQFLSIYRAAQDARGFMRTAVKHQELRNVPYSFDTTKLFVGGQSAGSVVAMSLAYFSRQSMFDAVYPGISSNKILGGINANFYYGDTTIKYKIRGVINMWGGLAIPPTYLDSPEAFFRQDDTIPPMISFQGHMDVVFADTFKVINFASSTYKGGVYNFENHCLLSKKDTFFLHPNSNGNADSYLLGEIRIDSMLRKLCKPSEYYLDSQMKHGLDTTSNPALYHSDFGTGATDAVTTLFYMVQRAGTFCQAVLNNKAASLITTRFFECENYRHGCTVADDNAGCPVNPGPLICH